MKKKIKGIFFDFDGVLIDSYPAMKEGWEHICSKYSIEKDFKSFSKYIGIPFISILSNLEIDKTIHRNIYLDYFSYTNERKHLIKLNPFVHEIIDWSANNSIDLAIVTSKKMDTTSSLVEYFKLNINSLITPELTLKGKPDPEPIIFAAKKFKIDCKEILFVGDMLTDMICAKNAGCYYLHYNLGYEELIFQEYGGEINSLLEIKEFIDYLI